MKCNFPARNSDKEVHFDSPGGVITATIWRFMTWLQVKHTKSVKLSSLLPPKRGVIIVWGWGNPKSTPAWPEWRSLPQIFPQVVPPKSHALWKSFHFLNEFLCFLVPELPQNQKGHITDAKEDNSYILQYRPTKTSAKLRVKFLGTLLFDSGQYTQPLTGESLWPLKKAFVALSTSKQFERNWVCKEQLM